MPATTSRFIILPNGDAVHPDDVRGVSTMSELDGTHAVCVANAHGASPVVGSFPTREEAEQARDDLIAQVDARAMGREREELLEQARAGWSLERKARESLEDQLGAALDRANVAEWEASAANEAAEQIERTALTTRKQFAKLLGEERADAARLRAQLAAATLRGDAWRNAAVYWGGL